MRNLNLLRLLLVLVTGLGWGGEAGSTLIGADDTLDELVTIDTDSGSVTNTKPLGLDQIYGLAFDSNSGVLYGSRNTGSGSTAPDELVTIDPSTGVVTSVGSFGFPNVLGLAFDPNSDTLYGWNISFGSLLTIDVGTGAATSVGGPAGSIGGLAFDPGSNILYGSDYTLDLLYEIDTATGGLTTVGALGSPEVHGLAFDPVTGTLYGSDSFRNWLVTIDVFDGSATPVGAEDSLLPRDRVRGLAVVTVPEPATAVSLVLGVLGLAGLRRSVLV